MTNKELIHQLETKVKMLENDNFNLKEHNRQLRFLVAAVIGIGNSVLVSDRQLAAIGPDVRVAVNKLYDKMATRITVLP